MNKTQNLKTTTEFPCGQTITMVRTMTDKEMKDEGWERRHYTSVNPTCLVLSDGTILYTSQDEEGNGPGMFFGKTKEGSFCLSLSAKN